MWTLASANAVLLDNLATYDHVTSLTLVKKYYKFGSRSLVILWREVHTVAINMFLPELSEYNRKTILTNPQYICKYSCNLTIWNVHRLIMIEITIWKLEILISKPQYEYFNLDGNARKI